MKILFCTLTLSPYNSLQATQRGYPLADERKPVWDWLAQHEFDGIDPDPEDERFLLAAGDSVEHKVFGIGLIISIELS